jgi:hypothetical protein
MSQDCLNEPRLPLRPSFIEATCHVTLMVMYDWPQIGPILKDHLHANKTDI